VKHGSVFWVHEVPKCLEMGAKGPTTEAEVPPMTRPPSNPRMPLEVVIHHVLLQKRALTACYEWSTAGQACRDARVVVAFTIDRQGAVTESRWLPDAEAPNDKRIGSCVAEAVKGITFPAPEGGAVRFVLPIRFLR
jgi:hypothetical protein